MSQLHMIRPNLEGLGEVTVPEGYSIRTYREGDEEVWAEIIRNSLDSNCNAEKCRGTITGRPQFRPEGLFFIDYDGKSVGTTCSWVQSPDETEMGYVHMVGVIPEHRGKRLSYSLSLSTLRFFRENGFRGAHLHTDDFRLPAIKTYLNLGFEPDYVDESHRARWKDIFEKLKSRNKASQPVE